MKSIVFLFLAAMLLTSKCVYIAVDKSGICLSLEEKTGSTYRIFYESTAIEPHIVANISNGLSKYEEEKDSSDILISA